MTRQYRLNEGFMLKTHARRLSIITIVGTLKGDALERFTNRQQSWNTFCAQEQHGMAILPSVKVGGKGVRSKRLAYRCMLDRSYSDFPGFVRYDSSRLLKYWTTVVVLHQCFRLYFSVFYLNYLFFIPMMNEIARALNHREVTPASYFNAILLNYVLPGSF